MTTTCGAEEDMIAPLKIGQTLGCRWTDADEKMDGIHDHPRLHDNPRSEREKIWDSLSHGGLYWNGGSEMAMQG